ncbi:hypothetical protein [Henriciella sp.]|uniref:hypothetical protein n=1 Tax=Henriciella sp. TaxID=1968823 RepID=UPI002615CBC3|nr:hypothetical protein [Henriciella sp.]
MTGTYDLIFSADSPAMQASDVLTLSRRPWRRAQVAILFAGWHQPVSEAGS